MNRSLFVSGAFRSGTTLLEKALSNHAAIRVGSQPFPFLYFRAKNDFYRELGIQRRYPLDHLFGESSFTNEEFTRFLERYRLSDTIVREVAAAQKDYFGWWTPELLDSIKGMAGGTLDEILADQNELMRSLFGVDSRTVIGAKEILCEEFVPYLAANGWDTLISLRDPRDVVTSLNFGKGPYYTGDIRPTLFVIRVWRKSVAFALQMLGHPHFHMVRYEGLLRDPLARLNQVVGGLPVSKFTAECFANGICDQFGNSWRGNSSFSSASVFNTSAIGSYQAKLPACTRKFVEACCWPEMQVLGYPYDPENREHARRIVSGYNEPFEIKRDDFPVDYSVTPENIEREIQRIAYLEGGGLSNSELHQWFLFPRVFEQLHERV